MRGVLWMRWGETPGLERSRASVRHWHPELPQHVAEMPADSTVLCKSKMYDLSPFEETLFLDADTTVLGKLDYGYAIAGIHGIALTHSANPWQRRYYKMSCRQDDVEYSSGVVFFNKRTTAGDCNESVAKRVFDEWKALNFDSRCKYTDDAGVTHEQEHNDQALLSLAIHRELFNPFVLPPNWNFVPRWQKQFFGPLKIWHGLEDIPQSLLKWNEEQAQPDAVIQCASL
jgi:hypothetical protein